MTRRTVFIGRFTVERGRLDEVRIGITEVTTEDAPASSHGWTLERMPLVDRAILQVAVFEIAFAEDVPDAVAISEAVRLATDLSTDESPQFVNGVLAAVAASSRQSS